MKRYLIVIFLPLLASCAYLHDRGRDACDIVTVAGEAPAFNASVQVGKGVLGMGLAGGKGYGLRSGAMGCYETGEGNFILVGFKVLVPNKADLDRDKGYDYQYHWFPWSRSEDKFGGTFDEGRWFNAWQIEAAVGVGVGARVGFNPAEFMDFIMGWTTLDICSDDIRTMDRKEAKEFQKSKNADNQPPEDAARKLADPQR